MWWDKSNGSDTILVSNLRIRPTAIWQNKSYDSDIILVKTSQIWGWISPLEKIKFNAENTGSISHDKFQHFPQRTGRVNNVKRETRTSTHTANLQSHVPATFSCNKFHFSYLRLYSAVVFNFHILARGSPLHAVYRCIFFHFFFSKLLYKPRINN